MSSPPLVVRRVDLAGDVSRVHSAVGRFRVDASVQTRELDPAVDRRELDLGARRHLDAVFDLKLSAVEEAPSSAREFRVDLDVAAPTRLRRS